MLQKCEVLLLEITYQHSTSNKKSVWGGEAVFPQLPGVATACLREVGI